MTSYSSKRMTLARLSSLSLDVIAASANVWAIKPLLRKNVLLRKRTLRRVSRLGRATKIAMTEIMFVAVAGTVATVAVPIGDTSTVKTVHARTRESIAMDLVRCTRSVVMATVTTRITTAAADGMAETAVAKRTITNIVPIAVVVTPSSKATTSAYRSAQWKRGKVMATVTTATISVVATGTVATVVEKQTRI